MTTPGKFISFEGIDGTGKSTQVKLLSAHIESLGIKCSVTREPGGSPLAEKLREILIWEKMNPYSELMLMFTARKDHVETVIKPHLAAGTWVISDRFVHSSYAYQGGGRGMCMKKIKALHEWTLEGFGPDLTLVLDMPITESTTRLESSVKETKSRAKLDKFELEDSLFFERTRMAFKNFAHDDPQSVKIIDANRTIDQVFESIKHEVIVTLAPSLDFINNKNPQLQARAV